VRSRRRVVGGQGAVPLLGAVRAGAGGDVRHRLSDLGQGRDDPTVAPRLRRWRPPIRAARVALARLFWPKASLVPILRG
jgi:hypothetical protein